MAYSLSPGADIGDYEVIRKIAEGGMGQVYLIQSRRRTNGAQDNLLVLKGVPCYSRTEANESLQEAKVLRDLKHDHIVQYIDVFPHDLNSNMLAVCTVMEYCDRGDLAEHMKTLRVNQHPYVSEPVVRIWMEQLLKALEYLHSSGILHRDIKPHNVFMTSQGDLKLGDFGLATALARGKITSRVGTPSYIAPEVLQTVRSGSQAALS
jgi:serine/threonine protein kinase